MRFDLHFDSLDDYTNGIKQLYRSMNPDKPTPENPKVLLYTHKPLQEPVPHTMAAPSIAPILPAAPIIRDPLPSDTLPAQQELDIAPKVYVPAHTLEEIGLKEKYVKRLKAAGFLTLGHVLRAGSFHLKNLPDIGDAYVQGITEYLASIGHELSSGQNSTLIADVGFTTRTFNALKLDSVATMFELSRYTKERLLMVPMIGKKAIEEIVEKLASMDMALLVEGDKVKKVSDVPVE